MLHMTISRYYPVTNSACNRSRRPTRSLRATLHHEVAACPWTHHGLPKSVAPFRYILVFHLSNLSLLMIKYSTTQFLHRRSNAPVEIPASLFPSAAQPTSTHVLGFLTVPEPLSSISTPSEDMPISETRVLENAFLVPSIGGFVVSGKTRDNQNSSDSIPTWSCSMPGGIAMVEWY